LLSGMKQMTGFKLSVMYTIIITFLFRPFAGRRASLARRSLITFH
jgi:hypothetical protein